MNLIKIRENGKKLEQLQEVTFEHIGRAKNGPTQIMNIIILLLVYVIDIVITTHVTRLGEFNW